MVFDYFASLNILTREMDDAIQALRLFDQRQRQRWVSSATTFVFMRELHRLHEDVDTLIKRVEDFISTVDSVDNVTFDTSVLSTTLEQLRELQSVVVRPVTATAEVG